jgi:hypothetical protein
VTWPFSRNIPGPIHFLSCRCDVHPSPPPSVRVLERLRVFEHRLQSQGKGPRSVSSQGPFVDSWCNAFCWNAPTTLLPGLCFVRIGPDETTSLLHGRFFFFFFFFGGGGVVVRFSLAWALLRRLASCWDEASSEARFQLWDTFDGSALSRNAYKRGGGRYMPCQSRRNIRQPLTCMNEWPPCF